MEHLYQEKLVSPKEGEDSYGSEENYVSRGAGTTFQRTLRN